MISTAGVNLLRRLLWHSTTTTEGSCGAGATGGGTLGHGVIIASGVDLLRDARGRAAGLVGGQDSGVNHSTRDRARLRRV